MANHPMTFKPLSPDSVVNYSFLIEIPCECGAAKCNSTLHSSWCPRAALANAKPHETPFVTSPQSDIVLLP